MAKSWEFTSYLDIFVYDQILEVDSQDIAENNYYSRQSNKYRNKRELKVKMIFLREDVFHSAGIRD